MFLTDKVVGGYNYVLRHLEFCVKGVVESPHVSIPAFGTVPHGLQRLPRAHVGGSCAWFSSRTGV